ncbi:hypothetical protein [Solidesulfovibrio sp.]|uniref:VgrG-related protein n=1 Tax=Solidesulfovibrio sp. TaxID=2910990 RepID=UPI002B21DBA2|nr:hypothetical protein [Solidesulfovibrio sp.]MEA4856051.1 hypothetical protein [Solidesulfovibrio sp.]
MPEAGYRVTIDTSSARTNIEGLTQSIVGLTGVTKPLSEQMAQLNIRYAEQDVIKGATGAVEAYKKAHMELAKIQGLTANEIKAVGDRVEQQAKQLQQANARASELNSTFQAYPSTLSRVAGAASALTTTFTTLASTIGAVKIVDFLRDSAVLAARYDTLGITMKAVGENVGYSQSQMFGYAHSVEAAGISMKESRENLTRMASAHVDLANSTKLSSVAQNAANIAGLNSSETYGRMINGIVSGEPMVMHALGINVSFENSYQRLAAQLHKTVDSLSEREKIQARVNETVQVGASMDNVYSEAMATSGKQMTSFIRYIEDFKTKTGEPLQPATFQIIGTATSVMKELQDQIVRPEATKALNDLGNAFGKLATNAMTSLPSALNSATTAIQDIVDMWNKMPKALQAATLGAGVGAAGGFGLGTISSVIGGPLGIGAGTAGGAGAGAILGLFGEALGLFDSIDEKVKTKKDDISRIEQQLSLITSPQIDTSKLTSSLEKERTHLNSLRKLQEEKWILEGQDIQAHPTGIEALRADRINEYKSAYGKGVDAYNADRDTISRTIESTKDSLPYSMQWIDTIDRFNSYKETASRQLARATEIRDQAHASGNSEEEERYQADITQASRALNQSQIWFQSTISQLRQQVEEPHRALASMRSGVLADQAALSGDKYTADSIKAIQEHSQAIDLLRYKYSRFPEAEQKAYQASEKLWLDEKLRISEATRELERWKDTLSTVGDLLSDLGRLSGSPEASYQGAMLKIKGQYKDASDQAKAMGISQDLVDQAYTLKAREAWQESYKGLPTIDGSAFDARRAMLSREVEDFRKAGADELALRVYAAQKAEDIARDELQTRQAYAGSFTDFLRGQVNIELGLYQGAHSRELQEWQDYYNDLKQLGQGWMDTTKAGLVDLIDGAITGKGEEAWKNMLANMRRQFIQFAVDIAMDFAKANIFKPALGGALGISGNETATKTVEGAARGLASQAVTAPSSESVLAWLGQGVPTYTPAQVAAPMQEAAKALGSIAGKYESGGNYGLVSRGDKWGDPGGVSYGKYQLSSVRGSLDEFLKASGYTDHPAVNSDAFKSWWKDQAQTSAFQQAQESFASEKFYKPVAEHLRSMGYGAGSDPGVQEMLMAMANAHGVGGADKILDRSLKGFDLSTIGRDDMIRAVYAERMKGSGDSLDYWRSSPANVQASVKRRLGNEMRDVLSYGSAGEEGTRAVASAASSYGLLGVNFGQLGAQSILSKIDTRGGLWSAFTGDSASYSWNTSNVTQAGGGAGSSFWTAPIGGNVWDVSTYTSALSGLSSTDATTAAKLVAMGLSPDDAVKAVTGGASGVSMQTQTANSVTAQQGTNFNASDLLKDMKGGSWVDSLNQWGFENLGIGSITGEQVGNSVSAFQGMNSTGWTGSTAGLGTIAGGALTGAMTGFGISGLVYPNGTGTIGGTIGGLAGGALGSTLLGSALGGPIGGLLGGVIGSVLGGSETKKTEKTGSGVTVNITNGDITQRGYSTYRTTTSGMFGSTSTSHSKSYDTVGDPELERAFASVLENYTAQNWRSSVNMGIPTAALKSFSFPFEFDINDENASFAAKSVANYQAYQLLDNAGLRGEFDEVAKSGEVYVDELKRISDAYNTGSIAASAAGTSLEKLAGTMSTVFQGDWFSQVADLLGGTSQASGAFSTYVQYGLGKTQAVDYALSAYAGGAGSAIAQIGDASVNMGNFWGKYQEAMNSGNMGADQFALWANAAGYMSSYSDTQYEALSLMQTINNVRIAQLKEEVSEVQNVKVMVDGLSTSISSAYSTYKNLYDTLTSSIQSITWNASLSPNTPSMTFAQQQAYYNELKTKVAGEDSNSITWSSDIQKLASFSQTYLQSARSHYGPSSKYYEIYGDVTSTLTSLQTSTKTELDVLQEQLAAQYTVVNQNQAQIDQLTLANTNLQILGAGLDGLGTDISSGLSAIVGALGSSWGSSWNSSVASAMQAYADAYASTTVSLATTSTVDTTSLTNTDWSALSSLTGYATGGDPAAGEWAYVGESGPELVRFGKSGHVYNANETKNILASKGADSKAVVAALQNSIAANAAGQAALLKEFQGMKAEFAAIRIVAERTATRRTQ